MTGFQMRTSGDEHNYYVKCAIVTSQQKLANLFYPKFNWHTKNQF